MARSRYSSETALWETLGKAAAVWPTRGSRGSSERPSRMPSTELSGTPMMSKTVGNMSRLLTTLSKVVPALKTLGYRIVIAIRVPASTSTFLAAWPWSNMNTKTVLSSCPSASSFLYTAPMLSSIHIGPANFFIRFVIPLPAAVTLETISSLVAIPELGVWDRVPPGYSKLLLSLMASQTSGLCGTVGEIWTNQGWLLAVALAMKSRAVPVDHSRLWLKV
mmetsp:Transcript_13637/g.26453  ORF Transcript_13637/g.26453 Transcript_13637/m.26453 type:complete len:220 (+) Transcript_13637:380-1039(+)